MERTLQNTVNAITDWASYNGFKFSTKKTKAMKFYKGSEPAYNPEIRMGNKRIPVAATIKFLGLTWDSKMSWEQHINSLKSRCSKDLNLLKSLTSYSWGADQETLIRLYRTIIRPKIDYGCIVYGSASSKLLRSVDVIVNEALRISSAAFKSTPIANLQVLLNEPPLDLRRQELLLRYFYKLKCHFQNPAYSSLINTHLQRYFASRKEETSPVIMRLQSAIAKYNVQTQPVLPYITPSRHSWMITKPDVDVDLAILNKQNTPISMLKAIAQDSIKQYNCKHIYTDGSKSETGVGAAAIMENKVKSSSMPKVASIFTAELEAINLAISFIEETSDAKYAIFSDSLSVLRQLQASTTDNHQVQRTWGRLQDVKESGKEVKLTWIPSHVGIKGNELADAAAKEIAKRNAQFVVVPYKDWYTTIRKRTYELWEERWRQEGRSMRQIKDKPGKWKATGARLKRRDQAVLNRLRLEHTNVTHNYRFTTENSGQPPLCNWCNDAVLSVRHMLITCPRLAQCRNLILKNGQQTRNFTLESLVGESCKIQPLMGFLKAIGMYDKI